MLLLLLLGERHGRHGHCKAYDSDSTRESHGMHHSSIDPDEVVLLQKLFESSPPDPDSPTQVSQVVVCGFGGSVEGRSELTQSVASAHMHEI